MRKKYKLLLSLFLVLSSLSSFGYDAVKRWKILEDGIKTHEMLFEKKHDFILGFKAYINPEIFKIIDQAKTATSTADANKLLDTYSGQENIGRLGLDLGIPLPRFSVGDFSFVPDFRAGGTFGFLTSISKASISESTISMFIPPGNPLLTGILNVCTGWFNNLDANGRDLALTLTNTCGASLSVAEKLALNLLKGSIIIPNINDIALNTYLNVDARLGLNLNYFYKDNIFGKLALYGLYRRDYASIFSAGSIAAGAAVPDPSKSDNTTLNLAMDFSTGYKQDSWSVRASIEEIKLSSIKSPTTDVLSYGEDPLIRLHADYTFDFDMFNLTPFAGFSKRTAYAISDGMYGGINSRFSIFGDRLAVNARVTMDTAYLTFAPMFKFWLLNLDFMIKTPVKKEVDGIKPSGIYGVNLRIAI